MTFSSVVSKPDRNRNIATAQLKNGRNTTLAALSGRQRMSATAAIARPRRAWM